MCHIRGASPLVDHCTIRGYLVSQHRCQTDIVPYAMTLSHHVDQQLQGWQFDTEVEPLNQI